MMLVTGESGAFNMAATDDDDAGHGWEQCLRYRCSLWWCWWWECVQSSECCLNGKLWSPRLLTGSQRHRLHSWPTSSPSSFAEMSKAPLSPMTSIVNSSDVKNPSMNRIQNLHQRQPKAPLSSMTSIITIHSQRHRSHPWPASWSAAMSKIHPRTWISAAKGTALTQEQHNHSIIMIIIHTYSTTYMKCVAQTEVPKSLAGQRPIFFEWKIQHNSNVDLFHVALYFKFWYAKKNKQMSKIVKNIYLFFC